MKIKTKEDRRDRIKHRIRKRVQGSEARPRLTVFRSVAHMYVQVVDDMTGRTIASASTVDPKVKGSLKKEERGGNIAGAKAIGRTIAERLEKEYPTDNDGRSIKVSRSSKGPQNVASIPLSKS